MGNQQSQNSNNRFPCQVKQGCSDTRESLADQDQQSHQYIDDYFGNIYITKSSVMKHHQINTNQSILKQNQLNSQDIYVSGIREVNYNMIIEKVFIDQQQLNQAINLVRLFQSINHPNIVQIKSVLSKIVVDSKQQELYIGRIQCDYYEQNLNSLIQKRKKLIQLQNEKSLSSVSQTDMQQINNYSQRQINNSSFNNIPTKKNYCVENNINFQKNISFEKNQESTYNLTPRSHRNNLVTAFSEKEIWYMLDSLIDGLNIFQENQILHGDLRPQTIYLTDEGYLKLSVIQCFGKDNSHTNFNIAATSIQKGQPLYQFMLDNNLLFSQEQILSLKKLRKLQSGSYQEANLAQEIIQKQEFNPYKSEVFSLGVLILQVIFCSSIEYCEPLNSHAQILNKNTQQQSQVIINEKKNLNRQSSSHKNYIYLINQKTGDIDINFQLIFDLLIVIKQTYSPSLYKILNLCLEMSEKYRLDCQQLYYELKNINLQTEASQTEEDSDTFRKENDIEVQLNKHQNQQNDTGNFQKEKKYSSGFQQINSTIEQMGQSMDHRKTEQLIESKSKQQLNHKQNKHVKNVSIDIMQTTNLTTSLTNSQLLYTSINQENITDKIQQLMNIERQSTIYQSQEEKQIKSRQSDIIKNSQYAIQENFKRYSVPSVILTLTDQKDNPQHDPLILQQSQQKSNQNKYQSYQQNSSVYSLQQQDKSIQVNHKKQIQINQYNQNQEKLNQVQGVYMPGQQKQINDKNVKFQENRNLQEQKLNLKEIKPIEQQMQDNIKIINYENQNKANSIMYQDPIRTSLNGTQQIQNLQDISINKNINLLQQQSKIVNSSDRKVSNSSDNILLANQKDHLSAISGSTYSTRDHTLSISTNINNLTKRKQSDSILLLSCQNNNLKFNGIGNFNKPELIQKSNERAYSMHVNNYNPVINSQSLINGTQQKESFLNAYFENSTNRNQSNSNSIINEEQNKINSITQSQILRSPYYSVHQTNNSNQQDLNQLFYSTSINMNDLIKANQDKNNSQQKNDIYNKHNNKTQIDSIIDQNKIKQEQFQLYDLVEKQQQSNLSNYTFNSPKEKQSTQPILQSSNYPQSNQHQFLYSSIDRSISQTGNVFNESNKNNQIQQVQEDAKLKDFPKEEDEMKHIYGSPKKVLISSPNKQFSPKNQSPNLLSTKNSNANLYSTQFVTSPIIDQQNYDDLQLSKNNSQTLIIISPQTTKQLSNLSNLSMRTATFNKEKSYINSLVQPNTSVYSSSSFQSPKNQISYHENKDYFNGNQPLSSKNNFYAKNTQISLLQNYINPLENRITYPNNQTLDTNNKNSNHQNYQLNDQQSIHSLDGQSNFINKQNINNTQAIVEKDIMKYDNSNKNTYTLLQDCQESKNSINSQVEIHEWNDIKESQFREFNSKIRRESITIGMPSQINSIIPGHIYQNLSQRKSLQQSGYNTNKIINNQNEQLQMHIAQTQQPIKQIEQQSNNNQIISPNIIINQLLQDNLYIHRRNQSLNQSTENFQIRNTTNSIHITSTDVRDSMNNLQPKYIQSLSTPNQQINSIDNSSIQIQNQKQSTIPIQNSSQYNIINNNNMPPPLKIQTQVQTMAGKNIQNNYISNLFPSNAKTSQSKDLYEQSENQFCVPYSSHEGSKKQMITQPNKDCSSQRLSNNTNNPQPQVKLNFLLSSSNMPQQYNSQIKALQNNKMYKEINNLQKAPQSIQLTNPSQREFISDKASLRLKLNYTQQQKAILLNQPKKYTQDSFLSKNIIN